MKRFQERYVLRRFRARERVLETLLNCYREAGGKADKPTIAVVDYDDVPTRTEHHMFRDFFEANGYPSVVCDPRLLTYESGRLRYEGRGIDIIYKRLLVNELLDRIDQNKAMVEAARRAPWSSSTPSDASRSTRRPSSRCSRTTSCNRCSRPRSRPRSTPTCRGRAGCSRDGRCAGAPAIDLPEFILKNRERLVMKPNDEYGGKGVFIGWEMTDSEWAEALHVALGSSYVVQEKVELLRQQFPELQPGAEGREPRSASATSWWTSIPSSSRARSRAS